MPSQGNHPSQLKHCSCRPDRTATQLSHHRRVHIIFVAAEREYCHAGKCHSLISLSLLQGGVLPCWQVLLSHIIVIAAGREYCHASRCHHADKCHSLILLSLLLQGGSIAMPASATLSALTACCSISTLLRRECDRLRSHLGYLPCY